MRYIMRYTDYVDIQDEDTYGEIPYDHYAFLVDWIYRDRERETTLDTLLFYFFSFYLYGHMAQWKRIRLRI